MAEQTKEWLVSFDTDRIKNYIFATNNLKEIRGASAILVEQDSIREEVLDKLPPEERLKGERIYSAGGGGAFLVVSDEEPQKLIEQIERDFRHATKTGSITAVCVPLERNWESLWFGKNMDKAAKKLQQRKSRKGELGVLPVEPYMRLCDACGNRPAEKRFEKDASGDLLCESCRCKRERGMDVRKASFAEGFVAQFKKYAQKFPNYKVWEEARPPHDLNELGSLDSNGYIGFLMIDGNQMGKLLSLMETKERYLKYSEKLKTKVSEIVFEVLGKVTTPIHGVLPFEIVLVGGDDVMLFTTANSAPILTTKILEKFEAESLEILQAAGLLREDLWERLEKAYSEEEISIARDEPFLIHKKLTMAAGLVLCHSNYPVPTIVEIGERLLKNAKKKCAERKIHYQQGAIDFQVITGSATDLDLARAMVPHNRPYTRTDMEKLVRHAQGFYEQRFPKNQLQMLYDACHRQSQGHGTIAALSAIARLKKRDHRRVLREFFREFSPEGESFLYWPWRLVEKIKDTGETELKTALVDLVDLYDFVKKETDHGKSH